MRIVQLAGLCAILVAVSVCGEDQSVFEKAELSKQIREIDRKAAFKVYKVLVDEKVRLESQIIRLRWAAIEEQTEEKLAKISGGKSFEQLSARLESLNVEIQAHREKLLNPPQKK